MESLQLSLQKTLADVFTMYFKAHTFHWNVEGPDFKQYHDLFGGIYEEVYGSIDLLAEHIRQIDAYTPTSLKQLSGLTVVTEDETVMPALQMIKSLMDANSMVLASLMLSYRDADNASELGLANFLQDRIAAHQKHAWMLKATLK
jgi:starvation-inducible DNA-binding protein